MPNNIAPLNSEHDQLAISQAARNASESKTFYVKRALEISRGEGEELPEQESSILLGQGTQVETEHGRAVRLMAQLAGQHIPSEQAIPDMQTRVLRARLIMEEAFELIQKGLGLDIYIHDAVALNNKGASADPLVILPLNPFKNFDKFVIGYGDARPVNLKEVADGVLDVNVVSTGTLYSCGIVETVEMVREVDNNNLIKFDPTKDGHRDDHGKWKKPSDHPEPALGLLLEAQEAGLVASVNTL